MHVCLHAPAQVYILYLVMGKKNNVLRISIGVLLFYDFMSATSMKLYMFACVCACISVCVCMCVHTFISGNRSSKLYVRDFNSGIFFMV